MGSVQTIHQFGNLTGLARISCSDACVRRSNCLLAQLSPETRAQLERHIGRPRILQRGQPLFMTGQACDGLYLINSGSFKAHADSDNGEEQITGFHFAGDILGFDGLENGQHTYSVEALETASVCRIAFNVLDELVSRDSCLRQQLFKKVARQISNQHTTIFMLGRMNAEQRLAQFFLKLSTLMRDYGCDAGCINLSMPRNDIANYLGLALETVSRLLHKFQSSGLLKVAHRHIQLLNAQGLQHIVNSGEEVARLARAN